MSRHPKPLVQLGPTPADPAYTFAQRWLGFNLGTPWGQVMLCLLGIGVGAFLSDKTTTGVVLTALTALVSLLVITKVGVVVIASAPRRRSSCRRSSGRTI